MKEVSVEKYNTLINLQKNNGTNYSEHLKGSRRILKVNNRIVCATSTSSGIDLGEISKEKFIGFIASFKRNIYSHMENNPDNFHKKIDFYGFSRKKNRNKWSELPLTTKFWNIDLSSAYWQMGYRLGYISKNFYLKYLHKDEYKQAKRLCFTFLARHNLKTYFFNKSEYTIECDNSCEQLIYDNVRNELYNIIAICNQIAELDCLEHNIDGITICCPQVKEKIIEYLKNEDLHFKINEGIKISDSQYFIKSKIRKF